MIERTKERRDWGWLTYSRLDVLALLADDITEREAAQKLGITYDGVRSIVEDIKNKTGMNSVRELARWWRAHRGEWLRWCAHKAGIEEEAYGR